METATPIQYLETTGRFCDCGCGRPYSISKGVLQYGEGREVDFELALVSHADNDRHVWVALISGPWTDADTGNCWVVVHGFPQDDRLNARVEELSASPWANANLDGGRAVTRAEVMSNEPAKIWVFECFNDVVQYHKDVGPFLHGDD